MVKRIVIHLGDCKTGSTSIQSILSSKAWKSPPFIDTRIEYPCVFNHLRLFKSLNSKHFAHNKEKIFSNIRNKFNNSKANVGVLSAEQFEFLDPAILDQALKTYLPSFYDDILLIAYVRPHTQRLLASYTERIKKGSFRGSLDQFYQILKNGQILNYSLRIEQWKNIFGDKYHVKPFSSSVLRQKDVVSDFFYFIFGHDNYHFLEPTRRNESVSIEDLAVLRHVQSMLLQDNLSSKGNARLGSILAQNMAQEYPSTITKLKLHDAIARDMMENYFEDATLVDSKYLNLPILEKSLYADCNNAVLQPQSLDISSYFDESAIRIFNCWIELTRNIIQNDPDHFLKIAKLQGRSYANYRLNI